MQFKEDTVTCVFLRWGMLDVACYLLLIWKVKKYLFRSSIQNDFGVEVSMCVTSHI